MAWSTREFINFHGGRIETCISAKREAGKLVGIKGSLGGI